MSDLPKDIEKYGDALIKAWEQYLKIIDILIALSGATALVIRASALEHHKGVRPSMFMRKSSSQAAPLRRRRRLVFFFPGGASRMMLRTIFRSSERFCGALSLRSVFPSSPKLTSSTQ